MANSNGLRAITRLFNGKMNFNPNVSADREMMYLKKYLQMLNMTADIETIKHIATTNPYSVLKTIMNRQLMVAPFTNRALVDREDPMWDMDSILTKVTVDQEGGMCYELNSTFKFVLNHLGFRTKMVLCNKLSKNAYRQQKKGVFSAPSTIEYDTPHPHTAVVVNDEWFCDTGFGRYFINPLPLPTKDGEALTEDSITILKEGEWYYHIKPNENNRVFQRFSLEDRDMSDIFGLIDWYSEDADSLWPAWTSRLYESRVVEEDGELIYDISVKN